MNRNPRFEDKWNAARQATYATLTGWQRNQYRAWWNSLTTNWQDAPYESPLGQAYDHATQLAIPALRQKRGFNWDIDAPTVDNARLLLWQYLQRRTFCRNGIRHNLHARAYRSVAYHRYFLVNAQENLDALVQWLRQHDLACPPDVGRQVMQDKLYFNPLNFGG